MGRIYLDSNGFTIKCEDCLVGEKLMFNSYERGANQNILLFKIPQKRVFHIFKIGLKSKVEKLKIREIYEGRVNSTMYLPAEGVS